MRKRNFKADSGSAILEFIAFVLIGQVLVLITSITLAGNISSKVELQLVAVDIARQMALGANPAPPEGVEVSVDLCNSPVLCLTVSKGDQKQSAVSF